MTVGKKIYKCDSLEDAQLKKKQLIDEGIIKQNQRGRPFKNYKDRYIWKQTKNVYSIQKSVNGKIERFGSCRTIEEARAERDYWERIGWDWDNFEAE